MNTIARASGSPAATARPQNPSTSTVSPPPSRPTFAIQLVSAVSSFSIMRSAYDARDFLDKSAREEFP